MSGFHGKRLPPFSDDKKFENFTADLWEGRYGKGSATLYGRSGQAQNGVDVVVRAGDRVIGVQCKAVADLKLATLEKEVESAKDFTPALTHFVLVTTAPHDAQLVSRATELTGEHRKQGLFEVAYFGWDELLRMLEEHPGVASKHFPEFSVPDAETPLITLAVDSALRIPLPDAELTLFCSETAWALKDEPPTVLRIERHDEMAIRSRLGELERMGALDTAQRAERSNLREMLKPIAKRTGQLEAAIRILLLDENARSPWLIGGNWRDTAIAVRQLVPDVISISERKPGGLTLKIGPQNVPGIMGYVDLDGKDKEAFLTRCSHFNPAYFVGDMHDLGSDLALRYALPAGIAALVRYAANHEVDLEKLRADGTTSIFSWNVYPS